MATVEWKDSAAAAELLKLINNGWFHIEYNAESSQVRLKENCNCSAAWPNVGLLIEAAVLLALQHYEDNDNMDTETSIKFRWLRRHPAGPWYILCEAARWYLGDQQRVFDALKRICSCWNYSHVNVNFEHGTDGQKLLWKVTVTSDQKASTASRAINRENRFGKFLNEGFEQPPVVFPNIIYGGYKLLRSAFGLSIRYSVNSKDWILVQLDSGASNLNERDDSIQLRFDLSVSTPPVLGLHKELPQATEDVPDGVNKAGLLATDLMSTAEEGIGTTNLSVSDEDDERPAFPIEAKHATTLQLAISELLSKQKEDPWLNEARILSDCHFDGCLQLRDLKANNVLINLTEGHVRFTPLMPESSVWVPIYELCHGNSAIELFKFSDQNDARLTAEISLYHQKNRISQICAADLLRLEIVDPVADDDNLVVFEQGRLQTTDNQWIPLKRVLFQVHGSPEMDAGTACIVVGTEFLQEIQANLVFCDSIPSADEYIAGFLRFDAPVSSPSLR